MCFWALKITNLSKIYAKTINFSNIKIKSFKFVRPQINNMKNLFFLIGVLISFGAKAQLYVQPTGPDPADASYVFVNDTFVYVDQDVELVNNVNLNGESNIILRNEGQLLQGNGVDQANKGSGTLSLFQEGTVNAWDYNAWASPVGIPLDASGSIEADGNAPFAFKPADSRTVFYVPQNIVDSQIAFSTTAYNGSTLNGGLLNIASYWLWSFQSGTDYADWVHVANTGELDAGYGFTMKGINGSDTSDGGDGRPNNNGNLTDGIGQRYDFRGRPNNGNIPVSVGPGQSSLVGNPYPSALDLDYFLLQNSGTGSFTATDINGTSTPVTRNDITTGTALFWDSNPNVMSHFVEDYQAGYGTYSPMMTLGTGMYVNATFYMYDADGAQIPGSVGNGIAYDRRFSPVGQGFFIEGSATQAGGTIASFTNNHRVFVQEGNNSDFRSNQNSNETQPVIGVATYYPDANNMDDGMPRLKIGVGINDTYSRELGIVLHKYATAGYDVAGDAKNEGLGTDVSFAIDDEKGYVINAAPQEEYQYIPITIDAETPAEFRFKVHYIENFEYSGVFLLDKLTETYYDILDEDALITLDAGEYSNRFAVRFTRDSQSGNNDTDSSSDQDNTTDDEETQEDTADNTTSTTQMSVIEQDPFSEPSILESFTIFQDNTAGILEIHNPREIDVNSVSLFDMAGKQLFTEQNLGNNSYYSFPTRSISTGIYIVQFATQGGLTKGQRISITN